MSPAQNAAPRQRSKAVLLTLAICAGLMFTIFAALGTWQIMRLQWKLALIEKIEQRVHAVPVVAPDSKQWSRINAANDAYRHVSVTGIFLYPLTVRVKAVTELGGGFWLLTPLQSEDGSVVLINRGFVPTKAGDQYDRPDYAVSGDVVVTGLLRMTEPNGGFLRHNDPAANLWYSRDVVAIAAASGLSNVAPYFVDADAAKSASGLLSNYPIGGMTVVAFKNNHLVYALTWYVLALMVAGACFWLMRDKRRLLRDGETT